MSGGEIGFIGLGIMGRPMVRNLMTAGYSLTVFDVVGSAMEEMVTEGAKPASSSAEVAASAPIVITMVPDSADSEAAILGENGVLEGTSEGSVIIDMSSIAPASSQEDSRRLRGQERRLLGRPGVRRRTGSRRRNPRHHGRRQAGRVRRSRRPPRSHGRQHRPLRRLRRWQHHKTGEPDHRCRQHRGRRRGPHPRKEGRTRPGQSFSKPSRAALPAQTYSTPRAP